MANLRLSSDDSPATGLLGQLEHLGPRFRRAVSWYVAFTVGRTIYTQAAAYARNRYAYTVSVAATDDIYPELHSWVLARVPEKQRRSLRARSHRTTNHSPVPVDSSDPVSRSGKLHLFYDGSRPQTVDIDGHRVRVHVEEPDSAKIDPDKPSTWMLDREKIVFTAFGAQAAAAVRGFLHDVAREHHEGDTRPSFFLADRWGGWTRRRIPDRPADTVVLADGQMESLEADLADFMARDDDYTRLGIPYHRGYLLHGPPGTGKTSIAKALASRFGLDLYYIALSDLERDTALLQMISSVQPGSLLLLEDVDVMHAATARDENPFGVSLAGLLNALDGAATPPGLITFLTTNHRDAIEPALLRPGRIDVDMHVGFLDDDQAGRLVHRLTGIRTDLPPVPPGTSPADLIDVLKRHLGDPPLGVAEVCAMLETKVVA